MPAVMTLVTMWQPAGLQFYFLCSAILGGGTGVLLRTPAVRHALRLTPIPTKESNEFFGKVIQEKRPLASIRGPNGNLIYQAPQTPSSPTAKSTNPSSSTPSSLFASAPKPKKNPNNIRGLNIKAGTKVPLHFVPPPSKAELENDEYEKDYQAGWEGRRIQYIWNHYIWIPGLVRTFNRKRQAIVSPVEIEVPKQAPKSRTMVDPEVERRKKFQNRK